MGRYFFFSGCALVLFHLAGLTSAGVLAQLLGFLAAHHTVLLASGLIGALALVCASLLFGGIGFFNLLYVMAKAVNELVQLFLCALSLASLVFWFDLGVNLWLEGGGIMMIVLYAWLYGAAFSLRVFDFNYPVKEVLLSYSTLPIVCMMVFLLSALIR
ncbi:MAG: hypothetical protein V1782_06130 [Pseudomonadota bacterium]